jgi:hypothetical protein
LRPPKFICRPNCKKKRLKVNTQLQPGSLYGPLFYHGSHLSATHTLPNVPTAALASVLVRAPLSTDGNTMPLAGCGLAAASHHWPAAEPPRSRLPRSAIPFPSPVGLPSPPLLTSVRASVLGRWRRRGCLGAEGRVEGQRVRRGRWLAAWRVPEVSVQLRATAGLVGVRRVPRTATAATSRASAASARPAVVGRSGVVMHAATASSSRLTLQY